MKTKEELNALKEEVETVNKKLHELTDEELAQVVGGTENNSTIVKDDDVVWLYEKSFDAQTKGSGAWYGISNSESKIKN